MANYQMKKYKLTYIMEDDTESTVIIEKEDMLEAIMKTEALGFRLQRSLEKNIKEIKLKEITE